MSISTIDPRELYQIVSSGKTVRLIDVRTSAEFEQIHVTCAENIPLDRFDPKKLVDEANGQPIYLICRSGARGQKACQLLRSAGCECVINVAGGTMAWDQAQLPVERGQRRTISLERQVRIIAGIATVVGAVLAYMVDSRWAVVPAMMGAGLAHAGLTDSCAMGMFLSKMPWNRA